MLGTILSILVSGFIIGALARWAVPGPDPMPVWLTILFGLGGSIIGGGIAAAALRANKDVSSGDYFTIILASILAASLLVVAYRRFVQKRPITGPEARKLPTRGVGVEKMRQRLGAARPPKDKAETLRKLDELHEQGLLTDEEYQARRAELLRRG